MEQLEKKNTPVATSPVSPLQQEGETTHSMLFRENITDQAADIEAYNQFTLPYTWWEKAKASANENLVQQFKRDVFAVRDSYLNAVDDFGRNGIDSPILLGDKPVGRITQQGASEEEYASKTTIRTAKELNEKYQTDKFQFPLDESLAEDFLNNRKAYERNSYIMQKDGESLTANLFGGLAGVIEPTNLVATLAGNALFKGATLGKLIAENIVSSGIAEGLQQGSKQIAAGIDPNLKEAALNTAVGTVFGTGLGLLGHKLVARSKGEKTDPVTYKEVTDAGNSGHDPNAPKGEHLVNNLLLSDENPSLKNTVENVLSTLDEHGANVNPTAIIDDLTPSLKESSYNDFKSALMSADSETDSTHAFKTGKQTSFIDEDGSVFTSKEYSTDPNAGVKEAVINGTKEMPLESIPNSKIMNLETLKNKEINTLLNGKIHPDLSALKNAEQSVLESFKELDPTQRIKALRAISELNEGKTLKVGDAIHDFFNAVKDGESTRIIPLEEQYLDAPRKTPEQILREAEPSPHFGDINDTSRFEEYINSKPELKEDLGTIQTEVDEKLAKMQESIKEGFVDENIKSAFEDFKRQRADFKIASRVKEMFVSCTRGIF